MPSRHGLLLVASAALALSVLTAGCSSGDDAAPPAHPTDGSGPADTSGEDADDNADLTALDIADDEPIVDEGNVEADRAGELDENPLALDEEEAPDVQPLSVAPAGEARASIGKGRSYKCPGQYAGSCVCEGSPLNCELPNAQPGRNRYLPPSFVSEVKSRGLQFGDVLEAGRWEVTPGSQIYDGQGNARGTYKSTCMSFANATGGALRKDTSKVCVQINFGQIRNMKVAGETAEHTFVYAFAVDVAGPGAASGWIRLDTVVDKTELVKMGSHAPRHVRSFASTSYVLKSAKDWKQDPKTFSADKLPSWSKAGVGQSSDSVKPQAGHYLLRDGNVINLIYSTPGVGGASTDTFLVEHEQLGFKRVKSTKARPTLVRIPLADARRKSMIFAFGTMENRFGWMALPSIKKGTVEAPAPAVPDACAGKADGTYCDAQLTIYGYTCKGGAIAKSLQCPAPFTHCVGASADGTALACDNR